MSVLDTDTIGGRLTLLCDLGGIKYRELDRLAGKSSEGYAAIVARNAIENPRRESVEPFCAVLGADVGYLLLGIGKAPSARAVEGAVAEARGRWKRRHAGKVSGTARSRKGAACSRNARAVGRS